MEQQGDQPVLFAVDNVPLLHNPRRHPDETVERVFQSTRPYFFLRDRYANAPGRVQRMTTAADAAPSAAHPGAGPSVPAPSTGGRAGELLEFRPWL